MDFLNVILKRLETVTTGFSVSSPQKWLFYWQLYSKCDIAPERCRPITFPGAISLGFIPGIKWWDTNYVLYSKGWNNDLQAPVIAFISELIIF